MAMGRTQPIIPPGWLNQEVRVGSQQLSYRNEPIYAWRIWDFHQWPEPHMEVSGSPHSLFVQGDTGIDLRLFFSLWHIF